MRNRWKVGDYLMVDDESGFVRYRSQLKKRWDGAWVSPTDWERRHPQEFVQARSDPYAPSETRPAVPTSAVSNVLPQYIGATNVPTPQTGAAAHLFVVETGEGIGTMEIGSTFIVRDST